jgi:hypothetical protein
MAPRKKPSMRGRSYKAKSKKAAATTKRKNTAPTAEAQPTAVVTSAGAQPTAAVTPTEAAAMVLPAPESGGLSNGKLVAIGLVVVALAVGVGVAVLLSQRNNTGSSGPPTGVTGTTTRATTRATTQPATTQPGTTPVTSCVVSGIDACAQKVYIRSTTEDGLNYPRLHNDVTSTGQLVRAIGSVPPDLTTHWKLVKTSTNNFMLVSQQNSFPMRVKIINGVPSVISCDPTVAYDLSKKGTDGVCAEFAITYNKAAEAFTISIPSGYPAAGTQLGLSGEKLFWGADVVIFKAGLPSLWKFEKVQ